MSEDHPALEMRRLGKTDVRVNAIGLGTWAWGAKRIWSYGRTHDRADVDQTWQRAVELGQTFLDTAMIYGIGESERIIGDLLRTTEEEMFIATKYFPLHLNPRSIRGAARASLRRLGVREIDLYQVHWPNPLLSLKATMREMERLVSEGMIRHIGVSNFNVSQLDAARSYLSREDVVSNQIHYSLIRRKPERDGMVDYAKREGVTIIAYSPIAQGILTGKYVPGDRPGGMRRVMPRFSNRNLRRVRPLLDVMDQVGRPGGRTMAQVSLAWLLKDPNVVVIPGAKNVAQLEENMGGNGWRIPPEGLEAIDEAYERHVPGW